MCVYIRSADGPRRHLRLLHQVSASSQPANTHLGGNASTDRPHHTTVTTGGGEMQTEMRGLYPRRNFILSIFNLQSPEFCGRKYTEDSWRGFLLTICTEVVVLRCHSGSQPSHKRPDLLFVTSISMLFLTFILYREFNRVKRLSASLSVRCTVL